MLRAMYWFARKRQMPRERRTLSFWLSVSRSSVLKDLSNGFIPFQLSPILPQSINAIGKYMDDADKILDPALSLFVECISKFSLKKGKGPLLEKDRDKQDDEKIEQHNCRKRAQSQILVKRVHHARHSFKYLYFLLYGHHSRFSTNKSPAP